MLFANMKNEIFCTVYILSLCLIILPITECRIKSETYKAAVVEYAPILKDSPAATIDENLMYYEQFVSQAKEQRVDIIVFPEYGLTTLVLKPEGYAVDLTKHNQIINKLTHIASKNNIYLVINLLEEVTKAYKTYYYNTNLVIDRSGNVIAKYRKINLFNEPNLTAGDEVVTFTTDFGVHFGTFICWDILSINPAQDMIELGVTDVVYPLAWFNTLPFYGALSTQHGYVLANNINLLVANYKRPELGNGGSGVFLSNGDLGEVYLSDSPYSKILIKTVAKKFNRQTHNCKRSNRYNASNSPSTSNGNFVTHRDFEPTDYAFKNIDLSKKTSDYNVCQNQICCNFTIRLDVANESTDEIYKLMVFDGITVLDRSNTHVRMCSLLACSNNLSESCGDRNASSLTKFQEISVFANFPADSHTFYRPSSLNGNLLPITGTEFCSRKVGEDLEELRFFTRNATSNVLVFGIYGQIMNKI